MGTCSDVDVKPLFEIILALVGEIERLNGLLEEIRLEEESLLEEIRVLLVEKRLI